MEKKYLINLECSINALAELIALGLEKHCTITKLEMFDQPAEEKKPELQVASHKIEFKHPARVIPPVAKPATTQQTTDAGRKITGWDVYEILRENFHPQKTFTTKAVSDLALVNGFDQAKGSISGHISRMKSVKLIERCGGTSGTGYIYRLNALRNKKDFNKAMSSYNNKTKAREQKKSADKNGWFNLAEFQRQYNAN